MQDQKNINQSNIINNHIDNKKNIFNRKKYYFLNTDSIDSEKFFQMQKLKEISKIDSSMNINLQNLQKPIIDEKFKKMNDKYFEFKNATKLKNLIYKNNFDKKQNYNGKNPKLPSINKTYLNGLEQENIEYLKGSELSRNVNKNKNGFSFLQKQNLDGSELINSGKFENYEIKKNNSEQKEKDRLKSSLIKENNSQKCFGKIFKLF